MNENEKLHEICQKIWYKLYEKACIQDWVDIYTNMISSIMVETDVRETIFTQEFMDKFIDCLEIKYSTEQIKIYLWSIIFNLDDPTSYFYNLIK